MLFEPVLGISDQAARGKEGVLEGLLGWGDNIHCLELGF